MNNFEFCNPVKVVFGKVLPVCLRYFQKEVRFWWYTVAVALRKMAFMSR